MSTELQLDKSAWKPATFGDVVSEVRKSTKDPVADGIVNQEAALRALEQLVATEV